MARVSLSLFEEQSLPVDIRQEEFAFGEVVYLTVGGFGTADLICLHLSRSQLEVLRTAIETYCQGAAAVREAGRKK
jgi:hypoxanthine phosphoribosyltransferase